MHAIRSPHLVWDHSDEKSSCGVGFITRKDGRATHDVIDMAREALCSVPHRGGISALGIGAVSYTHLTLPTKRIV